MKVDSPKNMDQVAGMCCRQAPLRGLIGSLIVCACFIGFAVLLRHRGFPWFVWGGCAVLAALLVPLVHRRRAGKVSLDELAVVARSRRPVDQSPLLSEPPFARGCHRPPSALRGDRLVPTATSRPGPRLPNPVRPHGIPLEGGVPRTVPGVRRYPGDRQGPG